MKTYLFNCGRVCYRFFLVLTCFLIAGHLKVYAGPDRKISITVSDMTVEHVLEKLNKEYSYNFGGGTWQVEGDSTSYAGGNTFYVGEDGEYSFTKVD